MTTCGAENPRRVISAGLQRPTTKNQADVSDITRKWSCVFSSTFMQDIVTVIGTFNASIRSMQKSMVRHQNLSGSVPNEVYRMKTPGAKLGEILITIKQSL